MQALASTNTIPAFASVSTSSMQLSRASREYRVAGHPTEVRVCFLLGRPKLPPSDQLIVHPPPLRACFFVAPPVWYAECGNSLCEFGESCPDEDPSCAATACAIDCPVGACAT
jgi:hypothetical protein